MTTIAYRDGVLATDSQVTYGSSYYTGAITKIAKREFYDVGEKKVHLAAGCGDAVLVQRFLNWFNDGESGEFDLKVKGDREEASFCGVVVVDLNTLIMHTVEGMCTLKINEYFADGSGSPFALGAMYHGATAEQAILAAGKHDRHTDINVQMERL